MQSLDDRLGILVARTPLYLPVSALAPFSLRNGLYLSTDTIDALATKSRLRRFGKRCATALLAASALWSTALGIDRIPAAGEGTHYIRELTTNTFVRGDSNRSGDVDISDAVHSLGVQFLGDDYFSCPDAADTNDDGAIDIADAVAILQYQFLGGFTIPAPFPSQGRDPTADRLPCEGGSDDLTFLILGQNLQPLTGATVRLNNWVPGGGPVYDQTKAVGADGAAFANPNIGFPQPYTFEVIPPDGTHKRYLGKLDIPGFQGMRVYLALPGVRPTQNSLKYRDNVDLLNEALIATDAFRPKERVLSATDGYAADLSVMYHFDGTDFRRGVQPADLNHTVGVYRVTRENQDGVRFSDDDIDDLHRKFALINYYSTHLHGNAVSERLLWVHVRATPSSGYAGRTVIPSVVNINSASQVSGYTHAGGISLIPDASDSVRWHELISSMASGRTTLDDPNDQGLSMSNASLLITPDEQSFLYDLNHRLFYRSPAGSCFLPVKKDFFAEYTRR